MAGHGGRIMRSSLGHLVRSFFKITKKNLSIAALCGCAISSAYAQAVPPNTPGAPAGDVSNIPKNITDTMEKVGRRNPDRNAMVQGNKVAEAEANCLLAPLSLIASPVIAIEELERTAKARNEYRQGCVAMKKKNNALAKQHFRKSIRQYPKYAVALVTLGQLLLQEQRTEEARKSCSQALTANKSYAPAYLCLADIGMREHAWQEVLTLSEEAVKVSAFSDFVAYEYHAAANLNLHDLAAAEKSGLRAAELDREHREPRIHFVLAQIYEAKGDFRDVATELRAYLKYTDSAADAAMVQQYLSNLEKRTSAADNEQSTEESEKADSTAERWAPLDVDASVPPVFSDASTCPLPEILKQASQHTLDLIEDMRRFSATEQIEQIEIDRKGRMHNSGTEVTNYVVEIEQKSSGYPGISEYRVGENRVLHSPIIDSGGAVFALIFHPSHIGNFEFRCEGLTDLAHSPAWQVHFIEGDDPDKAFTAIHMKGAIHLPRLKGRAWISTNGYNVLRIETDLVNPLTGIDIQREHQIITYAPVEFPSKHIRLWLPDKSSIYIATHRRHYQRVHTFGEFQLFSADSVQAVKQPTASEPTHFVKTMFAESAPFEPKLQEAH
jgi:tetratricopeptide (TPR) repeat protein